VKPIIVVAGLSFLLAASGFAQFRGALQVGTLIDDNAFNNHLQVQDRLTEVSLQGGYDWESERSNTQVLYTGTLNYFTLIPARTFHTHNAGLAYTHLSGEEDETLVTLAGSYTLRKNHEEFSIYDHSQITLSGNARAYLSDVFLVRGGYAFNVVTFSTMSDLNYLEHTLFLQTALSFPSRTTFIVQGDLGFKDYRTANLDTSAGLQSGSGWRSADVSTPGVTQVTGTIRIGQGITEQTGLSLTGQYQVSLKKESRYLTFESGVLTDDELFDDHYGYEGPMGSAMLTQMFPGDVRFRAYGSLQERRYSDRPALDLLGVQVAAQRIDKRTTFSLSLDKVFPSLGLQASLVYDYIINASNDAFYDYRNQAFSLRLTVSY
jgi:hypothetical protein